MRISDWSSDVCSSDLPVPLSNFVPDENRGKRHPAQRNTPLRCSSLRGLEKGRSVAALRSTAYCQGVRRFFHSASERLTSNGSFDSACIANCKPIAPPVARRTADPLKLRRVRSADTRVG